MTDRDVRASRPPARDLRRWGSPPGCCIERLVPHPVLPHPWAHRLALLLFALGLLGIAAVAAFRRAGTSPNPYQATSQLVTTGIYRFTRNPMYVGFTLWYLAAACWQNNLWPFLFLPIVLLVMLYGVILRRSATWSGASVTNTGPTSSAFAAGSSSPPRPQPAIDIQRELADDGMVVACASAAYDRRSPRRPHAPGPGRTPCPAARPARHGPCGLRSFAPPPVTGRRPVDHAGARTTRLHGSAASPRSPPPTRRTCTPPGASPPGCWAGMRDSRWWSVPRCTW